MKKHKIAVLTIISIAAVSLAATLSSCASLDKSLLTSQTTVTAPQTNAITGDVTPGVTNTVQVPKAALLADASVIAGLPVPYAAPIGMGLAWLLQAYAYSRQKKLSTALVTGIEAGRKILQQTPEGQALDAKLKDALIQHQELAGVLNAASSLVNSVTVDTVAPKQ